MMENFHLASNRILFSIKSSFYNFRTIRRLLHHVKALCCSPFAPFLCASISSAVGCPSFATLVHFQCIFPVQGLATRHVASTASVVRPWHGHLHSASSDIVRVKNRWWDTDIIGMATISEQPGFSLALVMSDLKVHSRPQKPRFSFFTLLQRVRFVTWPCSYCK